MNNLSSRIFSWQNNIDIETLKHGSGSSSNEHFSNNSSEPTIETLFSLKTKFKDKIIFGNLNINSLPNKFDDLKSIIIGNIDVFVLTETKLDNTFNNRQFRMEGFSAPFRLDRNRNGGGIMVYIRDDIPSRILNKHNFPNDVEGIFIELNLRSQKWLLCGLYHPPSQDDEYFFYQIGKAIDSYGGLYSKHLLIGDFNAEDTEPCLSQFLNRYDSSNLVSEKTCFKSKDNPSCIDLFVTNSAASFQNTIALTTGLSDFHKMVITILKKSFKMKKPKAIRYRDYKNSTKMTFQIS